MSARTGVVLAGGSGSRFGAFKPLFEVDGRAMLERVTSALRPHCAEILVMGGPHAARLSRVARERVFADPGVGPPTALRIAAAIAENGTILAAPADAPWLVASTFEPLLAAGPDAIFSRGGAPDPLVGLYHRESLRAFRGRSLLEIPARRIEGAAWSRELRDVDVPRDLE